MLFVLLRYAFSSEIVLWFLKNIHFFFLPLCFCLCSPPVNTLLMNLYSGSNLFVLRMVAGTLWTKHSGSICSAMGAKENVCTHFALSRNVCVCDKLELECPWLEGRQKLTFPHFFFLQSDRIMFISIFFRFTHTKNLIGLICPSINRYKMLFVSKAINFVLA